MKQNNKLGFTLVELLVVITILAIISVVAYQNFGGAVDKAIGGRKISDVSTIEAALQQYKSDNNFYPAVDTYSGTTNLWGYDSAQIASASNKIEVQYSGEEINTLISASSTGGGKVNGSGSIQIGAKGTISRNILGKKYLSKDLYDPEIGDLKIKSTGNKMIDSGIGRYVYAVYKNGNWSTNKTGTNYNIAYTVKKDGSDNYVTKIVGDYDKESCYDNSANCPDTLIGSWGDYLIDGQERVTTVTSIGVNQGIPYAVSDFAAAP